MPPSSCRTQLTDRGIEIGYYYILSVPYAAGFAAFGGPSIGGFRLTGWVFVIMLALAPLVFLLDSASSRFPFRIWAPWALIVILSLFWADGITLYHLQDVCQIITPFFLAPIASKVIKRTEDVDALFRAFAHCLIILLIALGLNIVFGTEVLLRPMSMTAAIIGCVFVAQYQKQPTLSILCWLGCIVVTTVTGSRMATLALLLIWLFMPAYRHKSMRLVSGIAVAVAAVTLFSFPVFQERFFGDERGTMSDVVRGEFSSSGRFDVWPELIDEIKRQPVIGGGAHSSADIVGQIWSNQGKPHNDYLRILLEQGAIGLLLFLFATFGQLISLWSKGFPEGHPTSTVRSAAFIGLIVLLLMAITDNPIVYGVWFMHPLFILIGASYAPVKPIPSGKA